MTEATASDYRKLAEDILEQPAFSEQEPSVLSRIWQQISDLFDPPTFDRPTGSIDVAPSGLTFLRSGLLILAVVVLLVWGARYVIKQRTNAAAAVDGAPEDKDTRRSATELEHLADQARRSGNWAEAVRYRFRAGLARLERKGAILFSPTLTSGEISQELDDPEFDELSTVFDAITYGDSEAAEDDEASSRQSWPSVIERAEP